MRARAASLLVGAVVVSLAVAAVALAGTVGVKTLAKKPQEFGNVVIDNFAVVNGPAPVVFKHWLHRSKFTCRLCHIDIGFGMLANSTHIKCDDVQNGIYCGACHDGKRAFGRMDKNGIEHCDLCHSVGKSVVFKNDFFALRDRLPRERFGNGVNWMKAEEDGLIKLTDYIEGLSVKRKKLSDPEEMKLSPEKTEMPRIIFSHEKHAAWNGCELCHPDIFGVKKGETVYGMGEIFGGKYCGACHDLVAFPNRDCRRCHTEDVE